MNPLESVLETPSPGKGSVSPTVRAALLSSLFDNQHSLIMSGVAAAFVALVAVLDLHRIWPVLWLVAGIVAVGYRFAIAHAYVAGNRSESTHPFRAAKQYAFLALLTSALLGIGSMACLIYGDAGLDALAIMVTAGTLGGVASRNAGVPRLAVSQIVLGACPIGLGALLAPNHIYRLLVLPLVIFVPAMASIVWRHYKTLVALMVAEQMNAELATRFDAALSHMPHGLCTVDASGNVIVANRRTAELFGATAEALELNVQLPEFIGRLVPARFDETLKRQLVQRCKTWLSEANAALDVKLGDGRELELTRNPVPDGSEVIIIEDVTERRRNEAKILHWAQHDALTGLPNRRYLHDHLRQTLLTSGSAPEAQPALMYLDLDNFKQVNDDFGHHSGDELLKIVARRLKRELRCGEIVGRLGGDEFAVVLECATEAAGAALAQRLVGRISAPYKLPAGASASVGVSIGIAFAEKGESPESLIERADRALYDAKAAGKHTFRVALPLPRTLLQELPRRRGRSMQYQDKELPPSQSGDSRELQRLA